MAYKSNYDWFIEADLSQYIGEWIAIVNNAVVAHDKNAKVAFDEAKKKFPDAIPFIAKIPQKKLYVL